MKRKTAFFISFLLLFQLIIPFGFGFELLNINKESILSESTDIPYQDGWPQLTSSRIASSPVFADLDSDGSLEIIIGSGITGDSKRKVYVFHEDGSIMDGWPISISYNIHGSPAVGDLDNDGDLEILAIDSLFSYAWHHDGTPVDGWPKNYGSTTSPTLYDIDGDNDLEIICGVIDRADGMKARIDVWNYDGTSYSGWPIILPEYDYSTIEYSSPAVGDVDGDGNVDIIVGIRCSLDGENMGSVYVFHKNGTILEGWPFYTGHLGYVFSSPGLCDLDGDGDLEIVIASDNGYVWVLHHNGTVMDGWPKFIPSWLTTQAIADVDNDGLLEIISGAVDTQSVYVWNPDGSLDAGWPQKTDGFVYSSPIVGDIAGDERLEIIATSFDHKVHAWFYNGTEVPGFPLETGDEISSTPCLCDLDGDGDVELIVCSTDKKVHVWDLSHPYDPDLMEWPMFQHDVFHTGLFSFGRDFMVDANGPYSTLIDTAVQLRSSVVGGTLPYSWSWDFGDGGTSTEKNPVHVFESTGEKPVMVTVTDDTGASVSDTAEVMVYSAEHFYDVDISSVRGGLGVSVELTNGGLVDAVDLNYSICFDGGLILSPSAGCVEGTVSIPVGESERIGCSVVGLSLGEPIDVSITVSKGEFIVSESIQAQLFFVFVILNSK